MTAVDAVVGMLVGVMAVAVVGGPVGGATAVAGRTREIDGGGGRGDGKCGCDSGGRRWGAGPLFVFVCGTCGCWSCAWADSPVRHVRN